MGESHNADGETESDGANGNAGAAVTRRLAAPDLARGFMLLLIVLAHAPLYLVTVDRGVLGLPAGGTALDEIVRVASVIFVDGRAYPMFAALFGYGLVLMLTSRERRGADEPLLRRLLRRRGVGLVLMGLLHALLITPVEILGAYGVAALLVGWLMFRPPRALVTATIVLTPFFLVTLSLMNMFEDPSGAVAGDDAMLELGALGYGIEDMVARLIIWFVAVVSNVFVYPVILGILLGALAAKYRVLENPEAHRRLLVRTAVIGVTVAVLGAVPLAVVQVTQHAGGTVWVWQTLQLATGLFGGLGYTAIFGLIGARLQRSSSTGETGGAGDAGDAGDAGQIREAGDAGDRREPGGGGSEPLWVRVLTASGRRPLTCYILQSAVLVALLSQPFFGLGDVVNSAGAAGIAVIAWVTGLLVAGLLERANRAGPLETALRWYINKPMRKAREKQEKQGDRGPRGV